MKNLKELIKDFAPALAAGLGGPIAGMATEKIVNVLFPGSSTQDVKENELIDRVTNGGAGIIEQLVNADKEFKLATEQMNIDVFKLEVQDKQSARETLKISIWPQIILSGIFILAYFILLGYIITHIEQLKPLTDDKLLYGLLSGFLGIVTSGVIQILGFWFGSSKGSQDKTHLSKGGH